MKILLIDNKDSFTFNLGQLIARITSTPPEVIGNDFEEWRDLVDSPDIGAVVVSPGPGRADRPSDFGICAELIRHTRKPLLGVCLGHQGLGWVHGASVVRAPAPMHGRISRIVHEGGALFEGIPKAFEAVRYHSLCLQRESIPSRLRITAATADGVPMAVEDVGRPHFGVQFHPESVCAEFGERLVRNFLRIAAARNPNAARPSRTAPKPPGTGRAQTGMSGRPAQIVSRSLNGWVDPQTAFERLFAAGPYSFWLDSSAVIPGLSRFSIMGDASGPHSAALLYRTKARALTTVGRSGHRLETVESLAATLRKRLARPVRLDHSLPGGFQTGPVGYLGYELRNELGAPTSRESELPDAALIDADRCLVFDHEDRRVLLVARVSRSPDEADRWFARVQRALARDRPAAAKPPRSGGPVVARLADGPQTYQRKIRDCQDNLERGESYQICLSSRFSLDAAVASFDAYRALRAINPAPFAAYLRFGDFAVLSSSPERFLRVGSDRHVSSKPIKGTSARDPAGRADAALAHWLRADEKSRAENLMIVDLVRNDLGRVAAVGSVRVPELMAVESYPTVHQLVSTVEARLRPGLDCLDCLAAAFPGGSMTGAPKLRTMTIIDRLEARARGPYAGAIGYFSLGDRMDLSIVIRTILMTGTGASISAGGGIVALSDPAAEFEEMMLKARAPIRAVAAAATGDPDAWRIQYRTA